MQETLYKFCLWTKQTYLQNLEIKCIIAKWKKVFKSNKKSQRFRDFKHHQNITSSLHTMAIQVVELSSGGTKLERFLHKNQHILRKLLNFEFWINGELSKIGHHFSNKKKIEIDFIKKWQ